MADHADPPPATSRDASPVIKVEESEHFITPLKLTDPGATRETAIDVGHQQPNTSTSSASPLRSHSADEVNAAGSQHQAAPLSPPSDPDFASAMQNAGLQWPARDTSPPAPAQHDQAPHSADEEDAAGSSAQSQEPNRVNPPTDDAANASAAEPQALPSASEPTDGDEIASTAEHQTLPTATEPTESDGMASATDHQALPSATESTQGGEITRPPKREDSPDPSDATSSPGIASPAPNSLKRKVLEVLDDDNQPREGESQATFTRRKMEAMEEKMERDRKRPKPIPSSSTYQPATTFEPKELPSNDEAPPYWKPASPKANKHYTRWTFGSPLGHRVERNSVAGKPKVGADSEIELFKKWLLYDSDIRITKDVLPPPYCILSDRVMGSMADFLASPDAKAISGEKLGQFWSLNYSTEGKVLLNLPPMGRPCIRNDPDTGKQAYMVFGGRILAGEFPAEERERKAKEQDKKSKGKKGKKSTASAKKKAKDVDEAGDDKEANTNPWILPNVRDRKSISFTQEYLGVKAKDYPPRQVLIDPDRMNVKLMNKADLSPRNQTLVEAYFANDLNGKGAKNLSPTHPTNLGDKEKRYFNRIKGYKPLLSEKASVALDLQDDLDTVNWLGTELVGYDFYASGQTKGAKDKKDLRNIILKAGGRMMQELDRHTILLRGGSGSGKDIDSIYGGRIDQARFFQDLIERNKEIKDGRVQPDDAMDPTWPRRTLLKPPQGTDPWTVPIFVKGVEKKMIHEIRELHPKTLLTDFLVKHPLSRRDRIFLKHYNTHAEKDEKVTHFVARLAKKPMDELDHKALDLLATNFSAEERSQLLDDTRTMHLLTQKESQLLQHLRDGDFDADLAQFGAQPDPSESQ